MTHKELMGMNIAIEGKTFTPLYTFEDYNQETDEYTNLEILKTAEEFYKEWLENKDKIDICPPKTVEERLAEAEQKLAESEEEKKLLKAQVEVLSNTTDFHEELIAEMASKVYA